MKQKINRGFVVETNFSPCRCYDKAKYHVMADDAVDLEHFQWMSEYDHKQVVSFFDKQGACPTCEEDITFDQHWIVTHQEEQKEKEKIFSVVVMSDTIHFKCNEGDLEDHVHEYIRNNIKDIEWTYEEETK